MPVLMVVPAHEGGGPIAGAGQIGKAVGEARAGTSRAGTGTRHRRCRRRRAYQVKADAQPVQHRHYRRRLQGRAVVAVQHFKLGLACLCPRPGRYAAPDVPHGRHDRPHALPSRRSCDCRDQDRYRKGNSNLSDTHLINCLPSHWLILY